MHIIIDYDDYFDITQYSEIDDSDDRENIPDGEEMMRGHLSSTVYKKYFHYGGSYFVLFMLVLIFIISQVATNGNDYWVSYWTNLEEIRQNEQNPNSTITISSYGYLQNDSFLASIFTLNPDGLLSTIDAIYVYTFCILVCTGTVLLRSFLFMKVCMSTSVNLHNIMFSNLLQARMSFFHINPSGECNYKISQQERIKKLKV